jgi:hypothetical protein
MRTRTLIALPVAAALAAGGASFATAADDPLTKPVPPKERILKLRAGPVGVPAPSFAFGEIPPGFDTGLGEDLAKELGISADKVKAAMRKVIENRLDEHTQDVLKCFDDGKACKLPPLFP